MGVSLILHMHGIDDRYHKYLTFYSLMGVSGWTRLINYTGFLASGNSFLLPYGSFLGWIKPTTNIYSYFLLPYGSFMDLCLHHGYQHHT